MPMYQSISKASSRSVMLIVTAIILVIIVQVIISSSSSSSSSSILQVGLEAAAALVDDAHAARVERPAVPGLVEKLLRNQLLCKIWFSCELGVVDSFQTGSGQAGPLQKCRDLP